MTRMLFYGETPANETGAARVNRHLLDVCVELGIKVEVLATSHFFGEDYDHARYPYQISTFECDPAEEATHQAAGREIDARAGSFDWLFISGDMHVPQILKEQVARYPSVVLGAIDGRVPLAALVDSFTLAKVPAVYSRWAYNQVLQVLPDLAGRLKCIQLGCEPDVFYPLPDAERTAYRQKAFGIDEETFLVVWANRNQARKDPARAMAAFALFHERVPNSKLFMLCKQEDMAGNIRGQAMLMGLDLTSIVFTQPTVYRQLDDGRVEISGYNEINGYPRDVLNRLYNAADVAISTSRGEGWGLTTSEFMAAGVPFVGPGNTTFYEMLGGGPCDSSPWWEGKRGLLVKSGGPELWDIFYGRDDNPRPLVSVEGLAHALYQVYLCRNGAALRARRALTWARRHTWGNFRDEWTRVLRPLVEGQEQNETQHLALAGAGSAGLHRLPGVEEV